MKPLPQHFDEYRLLVIPAGASQAQVRALKRAFYAGAGAVLVNLHDMAGDDVPDDAGVDAMVSMTRDVAVFCQDVQASRA